MHGDLVLLERSIFQIPQSTAIEFMHCSHGTLYQFLPVFHRERKKGKGNISKMQAFRDFNLAGTHRAMFKLGAKNSFSLCLLVMPLGQEYASC